MRERGVSTVGAVLLSAAAALLTATVLMDWVVVKVETPEPDAFHITVPFPLFVADMATNFIPDKLLEDAVIPPEARANREVVLDVLRALLDAPDAQLVRVETEDELVSISKSNDDLLVAVDADDAVVRCTVPIDGVLEALEEWDWERADPEILFDILAEASNGNLLTVEADDAKVAINIW